MNSEKGQRRKDKRRQFCLIYNGRGQGVVGPASSNYGGSSLTSSLETDAWDRAHASVTNVRDGSQRNISVKLFILLTCVVNCSSICKRQVQNKKQVCKSNIANTSSTVANTGSQVLSC